MMRCPIWRVRTQRCRPLCASFIMTTREFVKPIWISSSGERQGRELILPRTNSCLKLTDIRKLLPNGLRYLMVGGRRLDSLYRKILKPRQLLENAHAVPAGGSPTTTA